MNFKNANILSIDQFEKVDIAEIFSVAAAMEPYAQRKKITRVLEGAVLGNIFFEPSTRTRMSFSTAFQRLGGAVFEMADVNSSSLVKGESLYDTSRVMESYVDLFVVRHPTKGVVQEFAEATDRPLINGGDGTGEHPTQALLDLYTIMKEQGRSFEQLDGLSIAMVGDLKHGRTVHSLTKLLSLFKNIHFTWIAPEPLKMPESILEEARQHGHHVHQTEDFKTGIANVDVVYMTRLQEERFSSAEEAQAYRGHYSLNRATYEQCCSPGTIILHPLPRDQRANEIDVDLNDHPALAIFRQAANGIPIRMALFAMLLDVVKQVQKSARDAV
ncbi:MAG: aspartate carbamoyltransferase [Verrucomicrobiae bacterium]|nr:aspartate carbamoyltransferase [Verrucomicrobiae bacterium]